MEYVESKVKKCRIRHCYPRNVLNLRVKLNINNNK